MRRTTRRTLCVVGATLAATVLSLLTDAPAFAAGPTGSITGVVVQAGGTTPLAGTTVTAETAQGQVLASTTTAADGSYTLTAVPTGDRIVCAEGATLVTPEATAGWLRDCGYGRIVRVLRDRVTAGADRTEKIAAAVEGRVTEPGGSPLQGVTVQLGSDLGSPVTDEDGRYRVVFDADDVSSLAPCYDGSSATGTRSTIGYLHACHTFPRGQYSVQTEPGHTYVLDQLLQPAAALTGRVRDAAGAGLGGVAVYAGDAGRATTAADGSWTISGLPARRSLPLGFSAAAVTGGTSATGYLDQCWRGVPTDRGEYCRYEDDATPIVTPSGTTRRGLDVVLQAAGGITGRITDTLGRPVPGAQVQTYSGYVYADADGVYRATGLTAGPYYRLCTYTEYQVRVGGPFPNPDGYEDACWGDDRGGSPITVTAGQLVTGIDVVLQGHGGVTGRVLGPDGAPLETAEVDVTGPGDPRGTYSNSDGTFRLSKLVVGTYTVCLGSSPYQDLPAAAPYGYGRHCVDVAVQEGVTTAVPDTRLVAAGRISGTVTDVYGFALGNVYAQVTDARTGADVASVEIGGYEESGAWSVAGLAPGRYVVCFEASNAYRRRDYSTPAHGYASQCWRNRATDAPPVVVTVTGATDRTGISARIRQNAA